MPKERSLPFGEGVVVLRPAGTADLDAVLSVLNEAAGWLASRGIEQWPQQFERDWLGRHVARGDTWLVTTGERALGTFAFARSDPAWSGPREAARYVHRLAVRREARGLGRLLLEWARAEARRRDCRRLRLDCVVGNAELRRYYERCGFEHAGDVAVHGPPGDRSAPGPPVWVALYKSALVPGSDAADLEDH